MMNNARAEVDARSARGNQITSQVESTADFGEKDSTPSGDSESEGSGFGEEAQASEHRPTLPERDTV